MADLSDHELLILLRRDVEQLTKQLTEALTQLARGNARFEQIALSDQETKIALASLRQDFSSARLLAEEAKRQSAANREELEQWRTRLRTIVWLGAPAVALATTLITEMVRRWLFP